VQPEPGPPCTATAASRRGCRTPPSRQGCRHRHRASRARTARSPDTAQPRGQCNSTVSLPGTSRARQSSPRSATTGQARALQARQGAALRSACGRSFASSACQESSPSMTSGSLGRVSATVVNLTCQTGTHVAGGESADPGAAATSNGSWGQRSVMPVRRPEGSDLDRGRAPR
jgi:hypothetical protein